ncbi:acyltransferase family protein [Arthrobacter flavus]|uniref:Acyltransferase family protein n=1 Tax=Arthrobacter flavus TaxID=95172 RepID=A0ABW4Q8W8_9MICC
MTGRHHSTVPEQRIDTRSGTPASPQRPGYRHEVQGLRALAVLMVVVYHVWLGRVSGGVDVFLLISAFLLTLSFTRKLETGTPLDLLRYWVNLFRRLVPMAALTIVVTLGAVLIFVPRGRWTDILDQAWASLLYFQNWLLAVNSVDYYATDHSTASPFQHFWSLSIQGQVFILWPLLFAVAAVLSTRFRVSPRRILVGLFGLVFTGSLAFSVWQTATNQAFAYFDTRTRLWEFALGSLIALALPYVRLPLLSRVVLGWAGIVAMLAVGFVLQVEQQFPGYIALWPTLAAAAVIVAGSTDHRFGVDRFLGWNPLVKLGDASYALYLIHWPLLVIFLIHQGRESAGLFSGLAIIAVSVLWAVVTTRFVDRPIRQLKWAARKRRRSAVVIAVCALFVGLPLGVWQLQIHTAASAAADNANNPGAASLREGFVPFGDADAPLMPMMTALNSEWVTLDEACAGEFDASSYGVLQSGCNQTTVENPAKLAVVVGASHPQQWVAAIEPVAKRNNWDLVVLRKGQCPFGAPVGQEPVENCDQWNADVLAYLAEQDPDLVFTVSSSSHHTREDDRLIPGYEEAAQQIMADGAELIAIRDNPRFPVNMPECVEGSGQEDPSCTFEVSTKLAPVNPVAELAARYPSLHSIDMTDLICPDGTCPPVIGNVLVYMDDNHLSETYIETMVPEFERRLFFSLGASGSPGTAP